MPKGFKWSKANQEQRQRAGKSSPSRKLQRVIDWSKKSVSNTKTWPEHGPIFSQPRVDKKRITLAHMSIEKEKPDKE